MIGLVLALAVYYDRKCYRIPNQLIIAAYIVYLVLDLVEYGAVGALIFLANALMPIILLYVLFLMGGMGAGDIKIFSLICTAVGPQMTVNILIVSIFVAAAIVTVLSIREHHLILERKLHYSYYISAGYLLCQVMQIHF
ncbi:MAG: prepilin peptidase [Pseudobutyrivibrio sp.]|nr:prepilin peptidase [Pseudobutyrivibrio sp.]